MYESSFASALSRVRLGVGRVGAHAHPVAFDLDVRLEAQHLGGVPLDLLDVVGLDVDEAERRPVGRRKPLLELCERRPEREFDRLESPAVIDRTRLGVRREHLELEHLHAAFTHLSGDLAHELRRKAAPPRFGPDIDDVEEAEPLPLPLRDREAVLACEQDDLVADRVLEPSKVLGKVVLAPRLVRNLRIERLPQLADERQVVGGGGTDHGVRYWARR